MENSDTTKKQLRALFERIERLEEEKKALAEDIREVFAEAKIMGFDVKAIRAVLKIRKQEPHVQEEHEAIVETYRIALGDLEGTELGNYAINQVMARQGSEAEF